MSYFITSVSKYREWWPVATVLILGLVIGINSGYPPTENQVFWGINVWFGRIMALCMIILGSIRLKRKWGNLAWMFFITSPSVWGAWMGEIIGSTLLGFYLFLISYKTRWAKWSIVLILLLTAFNNFNRASIWQSVKLNDVENEVIRRFTSEDSLSQKVEFPDMVRRLATNKLTIGAVRWWREIVSVADWETLYFSEMHPLPRKTLPVFFWPGVIFLILGVIKTKKDLWLVLPGLIYFWVSDGPWQARYLWLIPGLAVLMGNGWDLAYKYKKILGVVLLFVYGYGTVAFFRDLTLRPDYWLNNRPIVYQKVFGWIKEIDKGKIEVTDVMGSSQKYCQYYLGRDRCLNIKFGIEQRWEKGGIYVGFIGEILGRDFNNKFSDNWEEALENQGFEVLAKHKMRDSVAYGYGDWIVVAKKI